VYGSEGIDYIYGDFADTTETRGGDDIIYTGFGTGSDTVSGGWGNDKIYGQGEASHKLSGNWGDDKIWGSAGNDRIWGDDDSGDPDNSIDASTGIYTENGKQSGDDTLYGGKGED